MKIGEMTFVDIKEVMRDLTRLVDNSTYPELHKELDELVFEIESCKQDIGEHYGNDASSK